jgi:hypothetical protein
MVKKREEEGGGEKKKKKEGKGEKGTCELKLHFN